jgi:outer membrane lipoprotein carrier protein
MFHILLPALLFVLIFSGFSISSATSADDVVTMVQKRYEEIRDMKGDFSQTSYLKDLEKVEKYEGVFYLKKPSSMKWAYSRPRDEEVTIRDLHTWVYKKSEKQVLKTTFSKDAYAQIPMAMLNSLGDLRNDYEISLIEENVLELRPKRTMGYVKNIVLEVNSRGFPVKTFKITDTYGNKVSVGIDNVSVNSGIKESFFIFKTPPGVEVFDLGR